MTFQTGYEPLLKAITDNNKATLEGLLKPSGTYSVNEEIPYISEDGKKYTITPLYWAVKLGHQDLCGYFLRRGAEPYHHMVYEYYPLHQACNQGHVGIIEEFIRVRCNLNKRNSDGDTPLHIAAMRGHRDCVRLLLEAGADVKIANIKGQTPLQAGQYNNHTHLYDLFKEYSQKRKLSPASMHHVKLLTSDHIDLRHACTPDYGISSGNYGNKALDDTMAYVRPSTREVLRTHSFSGTSGKQPHYATLSRRRHRNETPQIQASDSGRPSLAGFSHDSQMVLPTQKLMPDPRRTKTCVDFGLALSSDSEKPVSETLSYDDIETDVSRKTAAEDSRVRVDKLVQCLDKDMRLSSYNSQGVDSLLESICGNFGFSEEEYACLKLSKGAFCSSHFSYNRTTDFSEPKHSLDHSDAPAYFSNKVTKGLAHLVFRTKVTTSDIEVTPTLMKVTMQLVKTHAPEGCFSGYFGKVDQEGCMFASLPSHPHIIKLYHQCSVSSRPFKKFIHLFCSSDEQYIVSPEVRLLYFHSYPETLEEHINSRRQTCYSAPYGMEEKTVLILLSQLLLALSFLDQYGFVISQLEPSDIYLRNDHLVLGNLSNAYDTNQNPYMLRSQLQSAPQGMLLAYPPELCHLSDCSPREVGELQSLQIQLCKCNAFSAGCMILRLFSEHYSEYSVDLSTTSLPYFSQLFANLLEKLVKTKVEERIGAFQGALMCMVALYGPTWDTRTLIQCEHWLRTEALHLYLQPSFKNYPSNYDSQNMHNKLLYTYLSVADANRVHSAIKLLYQ